MSKVVLVCVCLVGLTQLVWSQNAVMGAVPGGRTHGIPGYLDPRTGTFTTKVHSDTQSSENPDLTATPSLTGANGVWKITLNITLTTPLQKGDIVVCEGNLDVDDQFFYSESGAVVATVNGGSASCTVTIPYTWYLATLKTDMVDVSYSVSEYHVFTVGSLSQANISRHNDHDLGSVPVPLSGAVTTDTVPVRL